MKAYILNGMIIYVIVTAILGFAYGFVSARTERPLWTLSIDKASNKAKCETVKFSLPEDSELFCAKFNKCIVTAQALKDGSGKLFKIDVGDNLWMFTDSQSFCQNTASAINKK